MLQRQIIFKQLQELQRKQQLQELGGARNQHYINQLSSLKQALGDKFPSAVNEMPVHDSSQMLMVGKTQMMQGMPNESVFVPGHNHSLSEVVLSQPQFEVSLYGASTQNSDKNLDLYSHVQGPPDHSASLSTKKNNGPLEMPSMQPSRFSNTLLNPGSTIYSDQIISPNESLPPNQVPVQGFNSGFSDGNYSHQGMTAQRNPLPLESQARQGNEGWHVSSRPALSDPAASLDPLEQKFLYSTDENIWGSSFSRSIKIGLGAFESAMENTSNMDGFPTTQSGSWSALMQSAVAETSSGDGWTQEEWSGLNFQNPEPLADNQTSNYTNNAKQTSNWVDTNQQTSSPQSAKPEIVNNNSTINGTFPGFQQSGHQYLRQKEGFHSESSHVSNQQSLRNTTQYNCQQKHPIGGGQLFQDHELGDTVRLYGSSPDIQKPFDQVDHKIMGNSCSTYPSSDKVNNHFESQHSPASPKPTDMATYNLVYSADYSHLKNVNFIGSEFPVLKNEHLTQGAETSVSSQYVGFPTGLASQWVDVTTQRYVSSEKPKKSSNFFHSISSENCSLETCLVAPNEQSGKNSLKEENNVQGFCASSGKTEYCEQQLGTESLLQKGLTEINNSISTGRCNHDQELYIEHHLEGNAVTSNSLMTQSHQPSNTLEQIDTEMPSCTTRDMNSLASSQNKALLHQVQSSRNASVTNAKDLFWHGQKGINSDAKDYSDIVSHFHAFSSLDNKGWDLHGAFREQSDKGYPPNVQNVQMLDQNDRDGACNTMYHSQISLQLAQSVSKNDGALKNGQPNYDPIAASYTVQQFSGLTTESTILPSTTSTLIASVQLSTDELPSYVTSQNMTVSVSKKRKVAFDMVPWHKEVNYDSFMLQNIRVAELEWAEVLNRRPQEVKNEAEILEDMHPRFRAKRRLVFTTQLMQQVFQPAPAVIFSSDASSNCDGVTYFEARFSFADACLETSNSQMPSDKNGISPDKLKNYKRRIASDLSEVVESLFNEVKRLEGELLRMDKSLSIVDINVETQELEKFSIINRFAKFHIQAQPTGADPTAPNASSVYKTYPQRYVSAHSMPKTVPEGTVCHSL